MDETWKTIERLCDWLDAESPVQGRTERLMRILKIGEEYGEVAGALRGLLGAHPGKGKTHTIDDLCDELGDVIVTSMVALVSVADDAREVFDTRLREIAHRSPG
ncbi:MazG-like family protein [Streptomyces phytophilus]|uniref:MazG-like family protein n=1 Tax=Streptomyces phytophilus TaxID=722715 RepID=UPI0015F04A5A|nr:MazG-like family protein [Streptomyces phytophilus]